MLQRHRADLRAGDCRGGARRCRLGTVTAGVWMDNQEPQRLARATLDADLTLAMLDIDHFKSVNDRFGHQRGDEMLVEFAGRAARVE
jgi:diguanylate cyclase (GGDEF)-like protein